MQVAQDDDVLDHGHHEEDLLSHDLGRLDCAIAGLAAQKGAWRHSHVLRLECQHQAILVQDWESKMPP